MKSKIINTIVEKKYIITFLKYKYIYINGQFS